MITIKRILCPIDFSEYSRQAIDRAVALAGEYSGSITALHVVTQVVPPRPPDLPVLYPPIVYTPEDLQQFRTHTRQFVERETTLNQVYDGRGVPSCRSGREHPEMVYRVGRAE